MFRLFQEDHRLWLIGLKFSEIITQNNFQKIKIWDFFKILIIFFLFVYAISSFFTNLVLFGDLNVTFKVRPLPLKYSILKDELTIRTWYVYDNFESLHQQIMSSLKGRVIYSHFTRTLYPLLKRYLSVFSGCPPCFIFWFWKLLIRSNPQLAPNDHTYRVSLKWRRPLCWNENPCVIKQN